ncbi:lipase family protein [uncultured Corynebacterium sp.]|uniref:lipase family protein n=1 Tax=uncultured Corynebacterium sp. TaxID=159447 RepID=UPI00260E2FFD|nr:lipase family protein [uncultured Corynebacterium sp.]
MSLRTRVKKGVATLSVLACMTLPAPAFAQVTTPPAPPAASDEATAPGTVVSSTPLRFGNGSRFVYTTTDHLGRVAYAGGLVLEPSVPWPGPGPVPTIAFAPGTRGDGDACANSNSIIGSFDPLTGAVGTNYESPIHIAASLSGIRVVVTDYIGVGTPSVPGYTVTDEEGTALIDAARAAFHLRGLPADSPLGFYGYSQGGGAAAAAAEQVDEYAPELNVKGTYSGAAPANFLEVMPAIDGSAISGVLGMSTNGYMDRYPEIRKVVDEKFNARGKQLLQEAKTSCVADLSLRWAFTDTRTLTTTGESFPEVAWRSPEFRSALQEQRLGQKKPTSPILVNSGNADDAIPNEQVRQMARDYCELGATVDFNANLTPLVPGKWVLNHMGPTYGDAPLSVNWLIDRFQGVPAPSDCGAI